MTKFICIITGLFFSISTFANNFDSGDINFFTQGQSLCRSGEPIEACRQFGAKTKSGDKTYFHQECINGYRTQERAFGGTCQRILDPVKFGHDLCRQGRGISECSNPKFRFKNMEARDQCAEAYDGMSRNLSFSELRGLCLSYRNSIIQNQLPPPVLRPGIGIRE
jgi:hypothetical protein